MGEEFDASVLVAGPAATAPCLVLDAPISFWGGVDPATGKIIDARHPQNAEAIGGRALCLPGTIGSSGASSVLLELVHRGKAPAALILDHPDAILLLGLIAAGEMGWRHPIAVRLGKDAFPRLKDRVVTVHTDGRISIDN